MPARAQRRQQREEVALGAADAGQLVQVQDLHRSAGTRPRARRPSARSRSGADVRGARGAEPRPQRRIARELDEPRARAPRRRRLGAGSRSRPRRRPSPVPPARVATTGPLGGERLDRDHRRSLVRGRQQRGVDGRVPARGSAAGSRRSGCDRRPRARARAPPSRAASSPSPTTTSTASTPSSSTACSVRTRSSGRLIGVSRPAQPIANVSSLSPSSAADARSRARRSSLHVRQVEPVRDDREASGRATPKRDEVVAHLLADRDERRRCAWASSALDPRGRRAPSAGEVAAQDVAVVGVDDRRGRALPGEQGREPAGRARLGRVRVQHVGPSVAQDRAERADRRRVGAQRELAAAGPGAAQVRRRARRRRTPSTPRPRRACRRRRARRGRARCCSRASWSTCRAAPPTFSRAIACTILSAALTAPPAPRGHDAERQPEDRRQRRAAEERRARERRRARPRATAAGTYAASRRRRRAATAAARQAASPRAATEHARADEAELEEHLVVGLLRDEAPSAGGK